MRTPNGVLYHGTSTARLKRILEDGRLRRATVGDQKIALTTERSAAEYSACNAVFGDKHDHPDEESSAVVLALDGAGLLALNYNLVPLSVIRIGEKASAIGKTRSSAGMILSPWTRYCWQWSPSHTSGTGTSLSAVVSHSSPPPHPQPASS